MRVRGSSKWFRGNDAKSKCLIEKHQKGGGR
jgi:hypothetical protein